jgi:NADPH:quinone reductase
VLDMVGADYVEKNLKCLALEGRLTQIGFLNGSRVDVNLHPMLLKRLTLTGSTLRASPVARKVALAQSLREHVWPLFAQKRLRIVIQETLPLAHAAAAHVLMESGRLIGKVMLQVRD